MGKIHQMQMLIFGLCAFSIGTWFGAYWRESFDLESTVTTNARKRGIQLQRRVSSLESKRVSITNRAKRCSPREDIFFLKTHKTAGTTVQNVLLRHADRHDSFVGLSSTNDARFSYVEGKTFSEDMVRYSDRKINMLCHHMRFKKEEVALIMPSHTIYITIVREPGSIFASFFDYLHYNCKAFSRVNHSTKGLHQWLDNTERYFSAEDNGLWWFAKNGMFYDLGFDNMRDDDKYIEACINDMKETYDLVLIADYFEESMILLKDLLCWDLGDFVHFLLNSRENRSIEVNDEMRLKIRRWNKADTAMYDYFNKTFWERVSLYGRGKMNSEIEALQRLAGDLQRNCIEGGRVATSLVRDPKNKVYKPPGVSMTGYNLRETSKNNKTCQDMVKTENQWFKYLLRKQFSIDIN